MFIKSMSFKKSFKICKNNLMQKPTLVHKKINLDMFIPLKTSQHCLKTFPVPAVIRCLAGRAIWWSILKLYTRVRSANTREPSVNTVARILRGNARWINISHCVIVGVGKEWLNQVGGNHKFWSIYEKTYIFYLKLFDTNNL